MVRAEERGVRRERRRRSSMRRAERWKGESKEAPLWRQEKDGARGGTRAALAFPRFLLALAD